MMGEVALMVSDAGNGLRERLDQEINAFNAATTGSTDGRLLCIAARDHGGDLRAGLFGWTWGGSGYIDLLWVRSDQRGPGLGTQLLARAEEEIARRGCDQVALSTHSFQAPGFLRPLRLPKMRPQAGLSARARSHPPDQAAAITRPSPSAPALPARQAKGY